MKNKFAKLFEFKECQVLVTKDFEENAETEFKIVQTTHCNHVVIDLALGFDDEEKRDSVFEKYGKKEASEFLKTINNLSNAFTIN